MNGDTCGVLREVASPVHVLFLRRARFLFDRFDINVDLSLLIVKIIGSLGETL